MEIKSYQYGGLVFRMVSPVPLRKKSCCEEFGVDNSRPADFLYELLPLEPDMPHEWDQPVILRREGNHIRAYLDMELLPGISAGHFLSRSKAAVFLPERGRFVLHASYILHEGQAILFSAPSGTGKSTLAHHWVNCRGAKLVNEDRVILSRENGVWQAHGCWATGTAGVTHNISAPVRAVVLLGQGRENRVSTLSAVEKLQRILPQCTFDEGDIHGRIRIIDLVSGLIADAPILGYDCLNHPSAVEELEKYI